MIVERTHFFQLERWLRVYFVTVTSYNEEDVTTYQNHDYNDDDKSGQWNDSHMLDPNN